MGSGCQAKQSFFLYSNGRYSLGSVAFCSTHFRCFFPGFALDFTAFPSFYFSFSCFFLHATATRKERSSSASEWSLGFTLKFRCTPLTLQWACHCHRCSQFTAGYSTLASAAAFSVKGRPWQPRELHWPEPR